MSLSKQEAYLNQFIEIAASKKKKHVALSSEEYQQIVNEVKVAEAKTHGRTDKEYRRLKR